DLLGASPNDYIRDRRLVKAEEMLSSSVERVNEICWAVGFQTPSYFIKCFRKKYGMSPTEYVRSRKTGPSSQGGGQ
ncbi:MAG: helix-turn-helix domain-containing protein, partial [Candidatus Cryptobacteroides sp.]